MYEILFNFIVWRQNERGISKRLRFEDEEIVPGRAAEDNIPLPDKSKNRQRRLRFEDEPAPESVLLQDNLKSRLRFEEEDMQGDLPVMDGIPAPKSKPKQRLQFEDEPALHGLPPPPRKAKERLRFEDEETTNDSPPALTSGHSGPKLKQQSDYLQGDKSSTQVEHLITDGESSSMYRDDEDPVFRKDDDFPSPGSSTESDGSAPKDKSGVIGADTGSPKAKKKAAREAKHLEKSQLRVDKAEVKLDKARCKLTEQKSRKPPGLIRQFGSFAAWRYAHRKAHQKVSEVEHENVGTESAHKTELAAESAAGGTVHYAKKRIRSAPARRVRKLAKRDVRAKARHSYRKLLHDNPELRRRALARFYHKQRLKMRYAKQARQTAKGAGHSGTIVSSAAFQLRTVAIALVKRNPKIWLIVIIFGLMLMLLQSCIAMFISIGGSMSGVVTATSYLAGDEDIDGASVLYTYWETDLEYRIINAERDNPDYDEFRFNIGEISHNPFELIAFLTAVYNDFTLAQVRAAMYEIFNEQYQLDFISELEIRTRTETRTGTGTWFDDYGNVHIYTYTYTVIVEYEWRILNTLLTTGSFTDIILSRMDEEQARRFHILMLTKGNRQYLQSPFSFNWLPFVTSLYGYRISPISGTKQRHWGLDIGLPQGTEILSGQDGTVIFAGDAGGYGLLVVIDDGEGLISRYAHCSVLYVSVGDEVNAGDVIARVGSTGQSTGPHLHIEIIKNGRHINPLLFTVTNHHLELSAPFYADDYITVAVNISANHYIYIPIVINHNPAVTSFTAFESNPVAPMSTEMFMVLIAEAEGHLGTPYVFGANGPNAFDCSGFVCWVFTHSGVYYLPRTTAQGIFNQSTPIPQSAARPGDLIFFTGTFSTTRTVTHVGIYTGGYMIHAGSPVQYTSVNTPFWQRHFYSFGRLNR